MNAYGMHACMLYEDGMHGKQREGGAVANYENQLGNMKSQLRNYTLDNPTEQSILNLGL